MIYARAGSQLLSDYPTALQLCGSLEERRRLAVALSKQAAVVPRLRIHPDSDVEELVRYWSRTDNAAEIQALLQSLRQTPGGGSISLLYLLPRFARERLYTFPTPTPGDPPMDCHWTSLNFFNEKPDPRFGQASYAVAELDTNYEMISQASRLGDVLLFMQGGGAGIHSCVYIAGDIVFTKNGNNSRMPWKFMHLGDLKEIYASGDRLPEVRAYRRKG
jgi:hypothetical protein